MIQNTKNITTVNQNKILASVGYNEDYADNIFNISMFTAIFKFNDSIFDHYAFSFARLMDIAGDYVTISKNECKFDNGSVTHIIKRPENDDTENPYINMLVDMIVWQYNMNAGS